MLFIFTIMLRIVTMILLPGLLFMCGYVLHTYCTDEYPEHIDLSVFEMSDEQIEILSRHLAMPYYSVAAAAMFLLALVFGHFFERRLILTLVCCLIVYVLLKIGTLFYLFRVVTSDEK